VAVAIFTGPEAVGRICTVGALQVTATLATLADATTPAPPVTVQISPVGCVLTVTL